MPRAILANVLFVSHILLLFHLPKDSQNKLQNMRNLENISHIALGTVRQQLRVILADDEKWYLFIYGSNVTLSSYL